MHDIRSAPHVHAKRIPGEAGLWVIVFGDLLVFGLFFLTFAAYRLDEVALFSRSQAQLNQGLGLLNTMLLLSSSLAVAITVAALREGALRRARLGTNLAILFGLSFIGVKIIEYGEKIAAGISPTTNNFFMFYFSFTSIHLLHVIAGLGALAFIRARCNAPLAPGGIKAIEGCAVFWHLVDILWVILFAILYLHR